jgi:YihY family inner membrane protein
MKRTPFAARLRLRIKNRAPKRRILYNTLVDYLHNDLPTSAAAVSYFGMLILFPTLLLISVFFPEGLLWMRPFFPGLYGFVRHNIEVMREVSKSVLFASFTVLFWAGSWIFTVIERGICRAWKTEPRKFLHGRLLTVGMMAAIGALLLASFLFTSAVVAISAAAERTTVGKHWIVETFGSELWAFFLASLSMTLTVLLFGLIYRFMPNTKVKVIEVVPGAVIAGVLWEAAKYAFAWMIPYFHYDLLYGTIGAAVALLTWSYVSSSIMFLGAQLTSVLHCQHVVDGPEGGEECGPLVQEGDPGAGASPLNSD